MWFVIGQTDNFGSGFTTLNWKPLKIVKGLNEIELLIRHPIDDVLITKGDATDILERTLCISPSLLCPV